MEGGKQPRAGRLMVPRPRDLLHKLRQSRPVTFTSFTDSFNGWLNRLQATTASAAL